MVQENFLNIYCDGGARGNPGPAAAAFVVFSGNGSVIYREADFLGKTTNNIAEYSAVIMALAWVLKNQDGILFKKVILNLDSELVSKQLGGIYKVKNENLKKYYLNVKNLEKSIKKEIFYSLISREKNQLADLLVNKSLDREIEKAWKLT